jgi:hypothetical protein
MGGFEKPLHELHPHLIEKAKSYRTQLLRNSNNQEIDTDTVMESWRNLGELSEIDLAAAEKESDEEVTQWIREREWRKKRKARNMKSK